MIRIASALAALAATLALSLPTAPVHALDAKTFVRSDGGGTACTRTAPCATFSSAIGAAIEGGEVNCLDSGPFSEEFIVITKSMTIDCAGTSASLLSGVSINAAGIIVRIRNLSLDGEGKGISAIEFQNGAALFVENCVIQNVKGNAGGFGAIGIMFTPAAPRAQLIVTDTIIDNNSTLSLKPICTTLDLPDTLLPFDEARLCASCSGFSAG